MTQKWDQKANNQPALIAGLFSILGVVVTTAFFVLSDRFLQAPGLKEKIEILKTQAADKDKHISTLETQLVPFKTIALERYAGDENHRLQQLAANIKSIKRACEKG